MCSITCGKAVAFWHVMMLLRWNWYFEAWCCLTHLVFIHVCYIYTFFIKSKTLYDIIWKLWNCKIFVSFHVSVSFMTFLPWPVKFIFSWLLDIFQNDFMFLSLTVVSRSLAAGKFRSLHHLKSKYSFSCTSCFAKLIQ